MTAVILAIWLVGAAITKYTLEEMAFVTPLAVVVLGATVGIVLLVLARRGRDIPIPFGPYLAAAGFIALLWGQDFAGRLVPF